MNQDAAVTALEFCQLCLGWENAYRGRGLIFEDKMADKPARREFRYERIEDVLQEARIYLILLEAEQSAAIFGHELRFRFADYFDGADDLRDLCHGLLSDCVRAHKRLQQQSSREPDNRSAT